MTNRRSLQDAFDGHLLAQLIALMDQGVVWRGVPSQPDEVEDGIPICRDRHEVHARMQHYVEHGGDADSVILAERGDSVAVEVRPRPGAGDEHGIGPRLFQVMTFRGDRIVLIQDYHDQEAALAALGS